ncbi:MAG: hypothetical protein RKO24_09335, partial [Candidatus Competibacter sp.]|nr:hypothetical protein [Candidatus Competibacter sp.]
METTWRNIQDERVGTLIPASTRWKINHELPPPDSHPAHLFQQLPQLIAMDKPRHGADREQA